MPKPGPRPAPRVHRAIANLQALTELVSERRRQLAREAGLSESQWRLLEEIAGEGFMPSLFARRRACTPAAVSRSLRSLLEAGLVRVSVSRADGRQRVYQLSARGRRALARLRESRERAVATVWARFGADELDRFVAFTSALRERLEAYARARDG